MYKEIKQCLICGEGSALKQVFDMGTQYVIDFVKEKDEKLLKAPLVLMKCDKCNLIQLKHRVNPDRLYKKMWYRSSINDQMKDELLCVVQKARRVISLNSGDRVLDIGCNDGTLLGCYEKGIVTVGVDPCKELVEEGLREKRIDIGISDYFSADIVNGIGKSVGVGPMQFKIITAVAMFYDLEDPVQFLRDCKRLLHGEGALVIQMNYLKTMLQSAGFDNISHEHLAYYSVTTLNEAVQKAGLDFQGLELSKANGGSIRAYITHKDFYKFCIDNHDDKLWLATNISMKQMEEMRMGLHTKAPYQDFEFNVQERMKVLKNYLEKVEGPLYAYGASTRGTALVQYLFRDGGSDIIKGVAERDEHKYGLKMVGTWWPIVYEKTIRSKCQHMLVLPWHFKESIVKREKEWILGGGTLIFPLPAPGLVTADELRQREETLA